MSNTAKEVTQNYFKAYKLDEVDDSLKRELKEWCAIDIETCLECGKCTGGCSNAHIFDFTPRKIIQLVKMGQLERLYSMDSLWTCVACQLCVDRCPAGIDIARLIDYIREKAVGQGAEPTRSNVRLFNELMLDSIYRTGRVGEALLMIKFNLKRGLYFQDADLGQKLFFKGKLKPFTPRVKNIRQVRRMFNNNPV